MKAKGRKKTYEIDIDFMVTRFLSFLSRAEEKETPIIRQSHEETIDGWIPAGCLFFLLLMKKEGQESGCLLMRLMSKARLTIGKTGWNLAGLNLNLMTP